MRLLRVQVQRFRNIVDSGVIDIEHDVTCLVGKNESGKTAVLEGLRRLNPVDDAAFDEQYDYPRWLLSQHRRNDLINDTEPILATFQPDPSDLAVVLDRLGPSVMSESADVEYYRGYGGPTRMRATVRGEVAVENAMADVGLGNDSRSLLGALSDFDKVAQAVTVAKSQTESASTLADLDAFAEEVEQRAEGQRAVDIVYALLQPRVPRFFYFSNYSLLRGRIDLERLAASGEDEPATCADQTARALLRLASTTPHDLMGDDFEHRKAELEAVASELSGQVFKYWKQNPNLRVSLDLDRVIKKIPVQTQYGAQQQDTVVKQVLDIRVRDTRHDYTNNFSQRSSGFQWFFSFLAAFTEFEEGTDPVIVLLDEPGLTLHGRAQADFLGFINERLASKIQVIYTTHSPFMIETDKLARIRVVEDQGPDKGAVVTKEILKVGDDSLFPLQAALGYDVAQNLFIGETNLLVEGPSDLLYLDLIGRHITRLGKQGLDERWRILPAGGASNIPAFITLLGQKLDVTVLIDSSTEGAARLRAAMTAGRVAEDRLIDIATITGNSKSDIEDLFVVEDYLTLYNKAFTTKLTAKSLPPGMRIVKRIQDDLGHTYDHYRPAEALLRNPPLLDGLGASTLSNFETLIGRINATIQKP